MYYNSLLVQVLSIVLISKLELVSRDEFEVLKRLVLKQDALIKKLQKSKKIKKVKKS